MALDFLHSQGKDHKHIRPGNILSWNYLLILYLENIFLSESGKFKLGNYKISTLEFDYTLGGDGKGESENEVEDEDEDEDEGVSEDGEKFLGHVLAYLSPEIEDTEQKEKVDLSKVDMYALGLVLAERILRVSITENEELLNHLKKGEQPLLNSLSYSEELLNVINSLLSKDPAKRPSARHILNTFYVNDSKKESSELQKKNDDLKKEIAEIKGKLCIKRKKSF